MNHFCNCQRLENKWKLFWFLFHFWVNDTFCHCYSVFFSFSIHSLFLWHMNNFSTLNEQCALLHCILIDTIIQKCNKKESKRRVESETNTSLSCVDNDNNWTKYAIKSNKMLCSHSIVCMCAPNLLKYECIFSFDATDLK